MAQITINVPDQHINRLLNALIGLYDNHLTEAIEPGSGEWSRAKRARWLHCWLLRQTIQRWEKSEAIAMHVAPIVVDKNVIEPIE